MPGIYLRKFYCETRLEPLKTLFLELLVLMSKSNSRFTRLECFFSWCLISCCLISCCLISCCLISCCLISCCLIFFVSCCLLLDDVTAHIGMLSLEHCLLAIVEGVIIIVITIIANIMVVEGSGCTSYNYKFGQVKYNISCCKWIIKFRFRHLMSIMYNA